jgi:hypothetical protein
MPAASPSAPLSLHRDGDRLETTAFPVAPFRYYRVSFESSAAEPSMWAAISFDREGRQLDADHYSAYDASDGWAASEFCFRGKAGAVEARLRLHPAEARIRGIAVGEVARAEVAAWADALWAAMPQLNLAPDPARWRHLPKTAARLEAIGQIGRIGPIGPIGDAARLGPIGPIRPIGPMPPLRIVMLGDSIVNDTGNSPYDVLVERMYPGLSLEVVTSVRGGTGCWYYKEAGRVKGYVLDFQPDLLMIGGISHNDDVESIRSVIHQARAAAPGLAGEDCILVQVRNPGAIRSAIHQVRAAAPGPGGEDCILVQVRNPRAARRPAPACCPGDALRCSCPDILLMTGAFGKGRDPRQLPDWSPTVDPDGDGYRSRLLRLAEEEGAEFFDLEGAWGSYLLGNDRPYAWFMRDEVHANARGSQLLGRILGRFFAQNRSGGG